MGAGHLLLPDVLGDGCRIAAERVTMPAGARHLGAKNFIFAHPPDEFAGRLGSCSGGIDIKRTAKRAFAATKQAPAGMDMTVGALLHRHFVGQEPVLARDAQGAAMASGPPVSGRKLYSSMSSGFSASMTSTGVFERLPSQYGPAS